MESTLVIKVKYGDTLRRFNACVDENEKLELDINGLREKILCLFNFPPDADLTLTYVDEDGDIVTLVDDDDLCEVMRQRLKFLRINVQLNNERVGKSYARSSESSTPMRSPRVQQPLPDLNNKVSEILKALPASLHEVLSKQSLDLASKAASSSPMLADLVESFLKMGLSQMNPVSVSQSGVQSNTPAEASESVIAPAVPRDPNALKDGGLKEVLPKSTAVDQTVKSNQEVGGNAKRGAGAPFMHISSSVDLNLPPSESDPVGSMTVGIAPAVSLAPVGDNREEAKEINVNSSGKRVGSIASTSFASGTGSCNVDQPRLMNLGHNFSTECPFSGIPLPNNLAGSGHPHVSSTKRNALIGMFHKGVQCDGCGAHPIMGSRFKSKVKEDYDLCSICFDAMGNETDYIRMDRPMHYRQHLRPFKGFDNSFWLGTNPASPQIVRDCRIKASRPNKLDSRFISDVNVLDGTIIAPSTPFTKIWRLRNCGTVAWPQGSQLLWIGGDKMSDAVSVEIEIPANGLPVEGELDIAVDFTAPKLPGHYISYWRLASPSGVKFGQRVWVLIQVDPSLNDSFEGLNLNLPPESTRSKGPEIIDTNVQPIVDGGFEESRNLYTVAEPVKPVVEEQPKKTQEQELNFPINDNLLVGHGASASAPPPPPTPWALSTVSYPIIDLSEVPPVKASRATPVEASRATPTFTGVPTLPEEVNDKEAVEQSLLKELEEMGFRQVDLNKEILRLNEYNLEQSVDDLCGVAEWDPILEELQEMGFRDEEMNKKLLKKNNGSIKRVVMDLLTGEKP